MKTLVFGLLLIVCPLSLIATIEVRYQRAAVHELQLDPQDAALRALAYDMQRCDWPRENISATLKFYLPGGDEAIRKFWERVDTDTHRPWFDCPVRERISYDHHTGIDR